MTGNIIPDFDKKINPTKKQIEILTKLRECKKITDYLIFCTRSDTPTRRNYGGYIRDYFVMHNITNPDKYLKDPRRMSNRKKIDYYDNLEKDVLKFNKKLETKSGSYRKSNLIAIRKLFEYNKIDLGNNFWETIRKNGKKAYRETDIETPTKEQLKNILSHADAEAKAFFLMKMTSGSRMKEILYLTFNNLHKDTEPPSFYVPSKLSKNGKATTKFFTPEAKYWLVRYLKNRNNILLTRINRAGNQKTKEEYQNRVFPMGDTNADTMWNNLLKKEELYKIDPETKHPTMGTHSLRRYFEDNIGHRKLSKYMLNKLSKSDEPYPYKTKNKLEQEYLKYMKNLYVFEETEETKEEIKKLQQEIDTLRGSLHITLTGKQELQKDLEKTQKEYEQKHKQLENKLDKIVNALYNKTHPFGDEDPLSNLQTVYSTKDENGNKTHYDIDLEKKDILPVDDIRQKDIKEQAAISLKDHKKQIKGC